MRQFVAALAISLAFLAPGHVHAANTWGTDMSDLWWNPNESGWGVNIAHQGEIVFMTMFVYEANGKAKWYVASGMASQGGSSPYTFDGTLYETTGPYLGGAFNPNNVSNRIVGTATYAVQSVNHATLSYSVDGVNVSKSIERQTFRNNNLSGSYIGAAIGSASGCGVSSGDFANTAQFTINHTGSNVSIAASLSNGISCTYSGTYSQFGRMGDISGSFVCTNGAGGTYRAFEIEASYQGFFLRYNANYGGGCTETGGIGGMAR